LYVPLFFTFDLFPSIFLPRLRSFRNLPKPPNPNSLILFHSFPSPSSSILTPHHPPPRGNFSYPSLSPSPQPTTNCPIPFLLSSSIPSTKLTKTP
jgi:hypothetical protein